MSLLLAFWLKRKADGGLWLDHLGIESAELATDCILPGGTGITAKIWLTEAPMAPKSLTCWEVLDRTRSPRRKN